MSPTHIAAFVACLSALAAAIPVESSACLSVPYVIYARGTDPNQSSMLADVDPTDGILEEIVYAAIPQASVAALEYPAAGILNTTEYNPSWATGIDNLQKMIEFYVYACLDIKIVLLGYSQGASVVTGALGGGQGRPPLAQQFLDAIVGGVVFADPSYVPNLYPLDELSTNTNSYGSFQDGNVQVFVNDYLGDVFRSLCSAGDEYCANAGGNGAAIHEGAEGIWKEAAITFLQSLGLG